MGAGSRKKRHKKEPGEKGPSRRSRRKEKAEAARPPLDAKAAETEEPAEEPFEEQPPPVPPPQPEVTPELEPGDEVIILEPAEPEVEEEEGEEPGEEEKLRRGLFRSRRALSKPFTRAATRRAIDPEFWQEAEEALIAADTGVDCATLIVERARKKILARRVHELEGLKEVFREEVVEMLESFGSPPQRPEERPAARDVALHIRPLRRREQGAGQPSSSLPSSHQRVAAARPGWFCAVCVPPASRGGRPLA